jgi:gliding motility-associated-like protein
VDAGSDVTIYIGNSTGLSASGNGTIYSWSPPTGLSCTDCPGPDASPLTTTAYVVTMTDDNGCTSTDTVVVTVEEKYELFLPTGFSPNGDGMNDVLYVRGNGIQWLKLLVFDRVGEKVWEAHSTSEGWDGTFRGLPMNSGVFVYYLEVQFYNNQRVVKEGDITLVR